MPRWAVLLRGVNVGGAGKLPMAELRAALPEMGARSVASYIQSGNLVLDHAEPDPVVLADAVSDLIAARFGFRPAALALAPAALGAILAAIPERPDLGPQNIYVYLTATALPAGLIDRMSPYCTQSEVLVPVPGGVAVLAPQGIGRSKLAAPLDRALAGAATARNLNTLRKVQQMVAAG